MAIRIKNDTTVMKVVSRLMKVIIGLYVGGLILDTMGTLLIGSESQLYSGLSFIGWTVGGYPACAGANYTTTCVSAASAQTSCAVANASTQAGVACVTATGTTTGILGIVGVVAIAGVVISFVNFRA